MSAAQAAARAFRACLRDDSLEPDAPLNQRGVLGTPLAVPGTPLTAAMEGQEGSQDHPADVQPPDPAGPIDPLMLLDQPAPSDSRYTPGPHDRPDLLSPRIPPASFPSSDPGPVPVPGEAEGEPAALTQAAAPVASSQPGSASPSAAGERPFIEQWAELTLRERQSIRTVLAHSEEDYLDLNEIARLMGIARCTLRTHLNRAYRKLGIHSRRELVGLRDQIEGRRKR